MDGGDGNRAATVLGNYEAGKPTAAEKAAAQSGAVSDICKIGSVMAKTPPPDEIFGAAPHERPVPRISIHAFCEFPDTGAALQRMGSDRRLSKAHLSVQLGGIAAAVEHYTAR